MDQATNKKLATALVDTGETLEASFVREWVKAQQQGNPTKAAQIIANAYAQGITITASLTQLVDPADITIDHIIDSHVQQFLANEKQATQDAVAEVVRRSFQYGWTPDEVAERTAQVKGLDGRYAQAVLNYEQGLLAQGISRTRAKQQARDYKRRLVESRARTIARTEIMSALNASTDVAWQGAVNRGTLPPDSQRVWIVYHDDRLCELCAPMQFQTAAIGEPFNSTRGGKVMAPPLHPNCRCTTGVVSPYGRNNTSRISTKLGIGKSLRVPVLKGDRAGHPFRGNQWTGKKLQPGGIGTAPDGGWDMSGDTPRWVQPHETLVMDALASWVGSPSDMRIHMHDELQGAAQPGSGSGKIKRAQAAALLKEINENGKPTPKLYRGATNHRPLDNIPESWSENRATANRFAKMGKGTVEVLPAGAGRGIRMADYIKAGLDEYERQWLVVAPTIAKHLPGKHDQMTHGRGRSGGFSSGEAAPDDAFLQSVTDQAVDPLYGNNLSPGIVAKQGVKFDAVNATVDDLEIKCDVNPVFAAEIDRLIEYDKRHPSIVSEWSTIEANYAAMVANNHTPNVVGASDRHKWLTVKTQSVVDAWQSSSSNAESLALTMAVANTLGVKMRWPSWNHSWSGQARKDAEALYQKDKAFLNAFARVTYKRTQDRLDRDGIKELTVFRGSGLMSTGVKNRVDRTTAKEQQVPKSVQNAAREYVAAKQEMAALHQQMKPVQKKMSDAAIVGTLATGGNSKTYWAWDSFVSDARMFGGRNISTTRQSMKDLIVQLDRDTTLSPATRTKVRAAAAEVMSVATPLRVLQHKENAIQQRLDVSYNKVSTYAYNTSLQMSNSSLPVASGTAQLRTITSFSTSASVAQGFGDKVVATRVPAKNVFATAFTGPGCLDELEVIVVSPAAGINTTIYSKNGSSFGPLQLIHSVTGVKTNEPWSSLDFATDLNGGA